jgi:two-component system sensor histidine kinase KdpD
MTLDRRGLLLTLIVVIVSALAANFVASRYDEVPAALVFMLGVTLAGALGGLASGLIGAVAAFLIFNFFISEPALTFRVATGRDLAPLIIFNLCAVVTGILAGRLRDRSEAARASNAQLVNLLTLSRALQSAARIPDIVSALDTVAYPTLGARLTLFRARPGLLEHLGPSGTNTEVDAMATSLIGSERQIVVARSLVGVRLEGSEESIGVLVLKGPRIGGIDLPFLDAFGGIVALALERAILSEQIAERGAAARAEELKTALLSSVSHDFRTPLTAISASASSLLAYRDKLNPETSERFLRQIVDDCERLNRYTANLLEMSKLEAGGNPASSQTLSVAEMVGVAVQRVRSRVGNRIIRSLSTDPDLLVIANPALFELVLINVLDNAILYSADGTRIVITAKRDGEECRISIADEGCGIPEADLPRVFERFYRVRRVEASPRGSGLGLAIAKGFVEALEGSIAAHTPGVADSGTTIEIRLPRAFEQASL